FRPRAARLRVVWYKFGLLLPLFSVARPAFRLSRPNPWSATLVVTLNQSWALKFSIWLLAPLVKWRTSVPRPPPLAELARIASELYDCGFEKVSVPDAG